LGLAYLWIGLALFFFAVLETVSHHFERSIFSKIKNQFWYEFFKSDWRRKYSDPENLVKKKYFDYVLSLIDGYHVSKWLMILCFALAFGFEYVYLIASIEYIMHKIFYSDLFIYDRNN
jgi:hypothetical protein